MAVIEYEGCTAAFDYDSRGPFAGMYQLRSVHTEPDARGNGQASAVLKLVCEFVDNAGCDMYLVAIPQRGGGLDQDGLFDWYERYGFERIHGHGPKAANFMLRKRRKATDAST